MYNNRTVFIATDNDPMVSTLRKHFSASSLRLVTSDADDPHLDLSVLARATHFVGNCVSSFSAFVKRERDVSRLPSSFWAFPPIKRENEYHAHDPSEL